MINFSFRKPILYTVLCLSLFAIAVILKATYVSPEVEKRYVAIMAQQPRKARKDKLKTRHELTKQVRWDVQKTMWITEGPLRRILELHSKRSEVAMFAKRHTLHFVETFYNAQGFAQQELFYTDSNANEYLISKDGTVHLRGKKEAMPITFDISKLTPKQYFRYFEAEKAIYDFDAETLLAMEVKFWTYLIDGHDLCKSTTGLTPIAIGQASSMTLPKKNEEREFYAENLRLQIKNEKGVW